MRTNILRSLGTIGFIFWSSSTIAAQPTMPSQTNQVGQACLTQKALLTDLAKSATPLNQFVQTLPSGHGRLLVLGEPHGNIGHENTYSWIITDLARRARGSRFCVFQEFSLFPDDTGKLTGDVNWLATHFSRLSKQCQRQSCPDLQRWKTEAEVYQRESGFSTPYIADAIAAKIQVVYIDLPEKEREIEIKNGVSGMNNRDAFMAKQLKEAFQAGKCQSGIAIVGSGHLTSGNPNRLTLRNHLDVLHSLKTTYVKVIDTFDDIQSWRVGGTRRPYGWEWNWLNESYQPMCGTFPGFPGQNFGFKIDKVRADKSSLRFGTFFDDSTDRGYWSDFDTAIVLGCSQPTQTCEKKSGFLF